MRTYSRRTFRHLETKTVTFGGGALLSQLVLVQIVEDCARRAKTFLPFPTMSQLWARYTPPVGNQRVDTSWLSECCPEGQKGGTLDHGELRRNARLGTQGTQVEGDKKNKISKVHR